MSFAGILSKWAESTPNKVALNDGKKQITFGELETKSNQLASYLKSIGTKRGSKVLIVSDKSINYIISVFGVLKAGAAYVAIDPEISTTRFCRISDETDPIGIIGGESWEYEVFPYQFYINYSQLDFYLANVKDVGFPEPQEMDVAYVIYGARDSNSAKGIQIPHKALDSFFEAMQEIYVAEGETSRFLNTLPYDCDEAIVDTFYPLSRGCSVYITPENLDPDLILSVIQSEEITHLTASAKSLHQLGPVFLGASRSCASVRYIMTGKEQLNKALVSDLIETFDVLKIINGYGPAEAPGESLVHTISKENVKQQDDRKHLIGIPLSSVKARLIEQNEDGVGELCLSGDQLFHSYLKRPFETRKVLYVVDKVVYFKTGDLCTQNENGEYHLVGKKENEIKLDESLYFMA